MSKPLVSVLMTAYNRERYIAQAIKSVLSSTYTNFELIIVDDCSSDQTVEIAQNYVVKDTRVKVFVNDKNLGDYPNRNQAASYATGKYLKYVDADDLIYPNGLEILVSMMEQFPEAGYGVCSMSPDKAKIFPFELTPTEAYTYYYFGPGGIFDRAPLSAIINKNAFDEVGGFTPIRMSGDFDMWHKLSQRYNVVLMPQGIIWYRHHDEQEMSHYLKYIMNYENTFIKYILSKDCPLNNSDIKKVLRKKRSNSIKQITKYLLKGKKSLLKVELEKIQLYTTTLNRK